MKKLLTAAAVILAISLSAGLALAGGGGTADPLISLSYLTGIFTPQAEMAMDNKLDPSDQILSEAARTRLDDLSQAVDAAAGKNFAPTALEVTLNEGDSLASTCGTQVIPLGGDVLLTIFSGEVIDVTTGETVPSGSVLALNHRYITVENSTALFLPATPTAVLTYQGSFDLERSGDGADYFGIASALRSLGLFRGRGTDIGEGFDLSAVPTRAEAIVMFIRILGEEDDALACSYSHPFSDVPLWLDRYVAWAYEKGYSNGISATEFGAGSPVSVVSFQEFILRALGYSVAGVDDFSTSLERALSHGVITDVEYFVFKECDFRRAHVAYLSYYTLDAVVAGSYETLAQRLQQQGVFTARELRAARKMVSSQRLH